MDGRLGGLAWAGVQCGVLCALSDPVRRLGQREALDAALCLSMAQAAAVASAGMGPPVVPASKLSSGNVIGVKRPALPLEAAFTLGVVIW